jgi:hypothetical protein
MFSIMALYTLEFLNQFLLIGIDAFSLSSFLAPILNTSKSLTLPYSRHDLKTIFDYVFYI